MTGIGDAIVARSIQIFYISALRPIFLEHRQTFSRGRIYANW